jgi:hypothetical protein
MRAPTPIGSIFGVSGIIFLELACLLRADIKNTFTNQIPPTTLVSPVRAEVLRGGVTDIPIKVVTDSGRDIKVEISRQPVHGTLQRMERMSSPGVIGYTYKHNRDSREEGDAFDFRFKSHGHSWSSDTARITILNPKGSAEVVPESLDFGGVPVGATEQRSIRLSNRFGAPISGTLVLPAPWTIEGDASFTLNEGEPPKQFTVVFTPTEPKSLEGEIKAAPEIAGFPAVSLTGEGVYPFVIDTTNAAISATNSRAVFRVVNPSKNPMKLEWGDDPRLSCSPPLTLLPGASGEVSVGFGTNASAPEHRVVHSLRLKAGSFARDIQVTELPPPGELHVEVSGAGKVLPATQGVETHLQLILRNDSDAERRVTLNFLNSTGASLAQPASLVIPPQGSPSMSTPWIPVEPGFSTPSVQVLENGKEVARAEWKFLVNAPERNPARASLLPLASDGYKSSPPLSQNPTGSHLISGIAQRPLLNKVAPWLRTDAVLFQEGLLRGKMVLRWTYSGDEPSPSFVLMELSGQSALSSITNRTGEQMHSPGTILHGKPILNQGIWEAILPMPWPGVHHYVVYPDTGDPNEKPTVSTLTIEITRELFFHDFIRAGVGLFGLIFLFCLFKVIRSRI